MRPIIFWIVLLGLSHSVRAQERCGSIPPPHSASQTTGLPETTESHSSTVSGTPSLPIEIVVPVVVHVVYRNPAENIGEDQIASQIEALNADFNRENADFIQVPPVFAALAGKAGLRFKLASSDPEGRPTDGILRRKTERTNFYTNDAVKSTATGGSDAWDTRQYLNVWVCNMPSNLQGYSSFPGGPASKDGIVIRYDVFGTRGTLTVPFNKGRTLTHEVGHWLGLRHLWGDRQCGDDDVHDTPRQRSGNRGIPQFPRINTGCENGPNGDMFMNFMDFSDDAALLMFTRGQVDAMRGQFLPGGQRTSLLKSKGLEKPWNLSAASATQSSDPQTLKVYPNPAMHSIRVTGGDSPLLKPTPFAVSDASGRVLLDGRMNDPADPIDVSRLPSGAYVLRVGGSTLRFMKGR